MTWWKILLLVLAGLVALGAIAYGIGLALPLKHVARVQGVVPLPAEAVAAKIRTVREYGSWRRGVSVEVTSDGEGGTAWTETRHGDRIALRLTEPEPGRRFVSTITDPTLPFGGQWTFTLHSQGDATLVAIQEDGQIRSPLFRFFAHFVFGYEKSLRDYLTALAAKG